jgi:ribosome biogenesis GTPase / thiamine phosphate phosphatase
MSSQVFSLHQLGWRAFFFQQLTLEDLERGYPARVSGVHRDRLAVLSERGQAHVVLRAGFDDQGVTVGDWLLIEQDGPHVLRVLERLSVIMRLAAGRVTRAQPIAANVDTLFVVTSCNAEFNASRLERYLALAFAARIEPAVLLTKADLCADPQDYARRAREVASQVSIVTLNATDAAATEALEEWLGEGRSVALVGSSGVGKSTLINTLTGEDSCVTSAIREADAKGRHTTTARQLIAMPGGAWLIDTPGMRTIRMGTAAAGVSAVFDDLEALARTCRYRDCSHEGDLGCALAAAVAAGSLEARRLTSYLKLRRETAQAARTLRERREIERRLGKLYKHVQERRNWQRS